ncbi:unnamed protein product [Amoebophrya sp. A25]|nr:unnamed protein product [Amoebophrya sp. A25]|eukprot:GSA25T00011915001.1
MPFTKTSTMWQLSFPCGEDVAKKLSKDPAGLKAEIVRRCASWHNPVPQLLEATPLTGMAGYPVYDREPLQAEVLAKLPLDVVDAAQHRRVTLMGDAAHPMTPFRAQGANQALSDAVLFAETLRESILKQVRDGHSYIVGAPSSITKADDEQQKFQLHLPHLDTAISAGIDAAVPIFERKMLTRSCRMVTGSREKAKELHSSVVLQQGRKVQRETGGIDMQQALRILRDKGITALAAADPAGLDVVVANAIGLGTGSEKNHERSTTKTSKKLTKTSSNSSKTSCPEMNDSPTSASTASTTSSCRTTGVDQPCKTKKPVEKLGGPVQSTKRKRKRSCIYVAAEDNAVQDKGESDDPTKRQKTKREAGVEENGNAICSTKITQVWGRHEEKWQRCVLLRTRKSGHEVVWRDGSTQVLGFDCIREEAPAKKWKKSSLKMTNQKV